MVNPIDVVTTRMYNSALYPSLWSCVRATAGTEGLLAFYKGLSALYLRLFPHTILTFVFWEQLKTLYVQFSD